MQGSCTNHALISLFYYLRVTLSCTVYTVSMNNKDREGNCWNLFQILYCSMLLHMTYSEHHWFNSGQSCIGFYRQPTARRAVEPLAFASLNLYVKRLKGKWETFYMTTGLRFIFEPETSQTKGRFWTWPRCSITCYVNKYPCSVEH